MRDIGAGGVLLVLSVALYRVIPHQVETLQGDSLTPASLPSALAMLVAVLAAILLLQGMRAYRQAAPAENGHASWRGRVYVLAVVATVALYIAALEWLGYLLASAVTAGALALLYGHRRWWQIVLLMLLAPPALLYFFRHTMLVLLPEGRLFE